MFITAINEWIELMNAVPLLLEHQVLTLGRPLFLHGMQAGAWQVLLLRMHSQTSCSLPPF